MLNIIKRKEAEVPEAAPTAAPMDVFENEKEFLLFADVPGVSQGGADVTINHERLVIEAKGETRKYRRELLVPPSVDPAGISATLRAGVLQVTLPKRAPYQPRQIPVRTS